VRKASTSTCGRQTPRHSSTSSDSCSSIDQLGQLLLDAELIDQNNEDGHPIVTEAPENQAIALWNWLYVAHEDKSLGVHNPAYSQALLEEGISLMQQPAR
jgi:hypothetical protein